MKNTLFCIHLMFVMCYFRQTHCFNMFVSVLIVWLGLLKVVQTNVFAVRVFLPSSFYFYYFF